MNAFRHACGHRVPGHLGYCPTCRSFPESEWSQRVDEALNGMNLDNPKW